VVGAVTAAVVAAGMLSASEASHQAPSSATAGGRAAVVSATIVTRQALDRRAPALSRDLRREAPTDAGDVRVQAAARQRAAALAVQAARAAQARRQAAARARRQAEAARRQAAAERRRAAIARRNAWRLPVSRGAYHLTSRFGDCSALWSHCHTGLDFAAPTGTAIHAVAGGVVTDTSWAGSYGYRTVIRLADGSQMWYCHQSAELVRRRQHVLAGQVIGAVGSTGNTTGPHVHLEVRPRRDDPVDPFAALVAHGLRP
jgi:murein DD-endopeptidase MepM/ murein hydrolase activator NlpD